MNPIPVILSEAKDLLVAFGDSLLLAETLTEFPLRVTSFSLSSVWIWQSNVSSLGVDDA
jgi:hypothetical protein